MIADWAERNLKILPALLFGATALVLIGVAVTARALEEPPPREADRQTSTGTLLVVMQHGCGACTYFEERVAPGYKRSPEASDAPLRFIDIAKVQSQKLYRLKTGVFATPTLLMIDGFGREVGRSVGSPRSTDRLQELVRGYMPRMLRKGA